MLRLHVYALHYFDGTGYIRSR